MSADPLARPVSESVYGEPVGEVRRPSTGVFVPLPSGNNAPPRIVPPGLVLVTAFPAPSVKDTLTGAAFFPLPTVEVMKLGPEASTWANCNSYGSTPPASDIG